MPGPPHRGDPPHELYTICMERFATLEAEVRNLKEFRSDHEDVCATWKNQIHNDITELKISVARFALVGTILGCIAGALVATVIEKLFP